MRSNNAYTKLQIQNRVGDTRRYRGKRSAVRCRDSARRRGGEDASRASVCHSLRSDLLGQNDYGVTPE